MLIELHRKFSNDVCTIGQMTVDDETVWTLEDPKREHKVWGETRIPAGKYQLTLRSEGGMTQRYEHRFPDMHQGMVWLRQVPMFEYVYIHIGNTAENTDGCILVGLNRDNNKILKSAAAYKLIYPRIVQKILRGKMFLRIHDE